MAAEDLRRRRREAQAAVLGSLRHPELRRVQLAWGGCTIADLAQDVALAVFAFSAGGVAGVGVMGLVRSVPAATLGPLAAAAADRYPRQRVLLVVLACRAVLLTAMAGLLVGGGRTWVVYVFAAVDATVYTLYWPAQSALLPELARTAEELTASNVAATIIENLGTLVGPVVAGVVLAVSGVSAVFGVSAALTGASGLVLSGLARSGAPAAPPEAPADTLLAGFRTVLRDRPPRLVLLLYLAHTLCLGAVSVVVVVLALDVLEVGQPGVGFLSAALGAGGLVGAVASLGLVGHRRLTRPFRFGLVVWGAALAVIGLLPATPVAVVALALLGGCTAVVDVCAINLLQRIVRERFLGRVLGVVEGSWWFALGLGSVAAAGLVEVAGARPAMAVIGGFLAAVGLVTASALDHVDVRATAPERELAVLRSVPLFAGQPPLALERLAQQLTAVSYASGDRVVTEGEPGDRFYLVDAGSLKVRGPEVDGVELGPGDWFGEVALLHDVPRTATVQAVTPVRLFALERDDFLAAVTIRRPGAGA